MRAHGHHEMLKVFIQTQQPGLDAITHLSGRTRQSHPVESVQRQQDALFGHKDGGPSSPTPQELLLAPRLASIAPTPVGAPPQPHRTFYLQHFRTSVRVHICPSVPPVHLSGKRSQWRNLPTSFSSSSSFEGTYQPPKQTKGKSSSAPSPAGRCPALPQLWPYTAAHSAGHPPSGVPWMGGPAVTPAPRAPGGEPSRAAVVDLVSLSGPSGGAGKRQSSA